MKPLGKYLLLCGLPALMSLPAPAAAFVLNYFQWLTPRVTYYTALPGTAPSGEAWSSAFKRALGHWRDSTVADLIAVDDYEDPCGDENEDSGNGRNAVDFGSDLCGAEFGQGVLAVANLAGSRRMNFGHLDLSDADITFNANVSWDIYRGPIRSAQNQPGSLIDFERVALHEIGHTLGLGHEELHEAIMQPSISNLDTFTDDDLAGIAYIYDGAYTVPSIYAVDVHVSADHHIYESDTLNLTGNLAADSDFVREPFIAEFHEFTLEYRSRVSVRLTSESFEPFVYLAKRTLNHEIVPGSVMFDETPGAVTAALTQTLDAGTYWVLVINCTPVEGSGEFALEISATVENRTRSFPTFENAAGATVEINPNPRIAGAFTDRDHMSDGLPVDIYQFELTRDRSHLTIRAQSTEVDTLLRLRSADSGSVSLENDDAEPGITTNSQIMAELPAGTYWLEVTVWNNNEDGGNIGLRGNYVVETFVNIPPQR